VGLLAVVGLDTRAVLAFGNVNGSVVAVARLVDINTRLRVRRVLATVRVFLVSVKGRAFLCGRRKACVVPPSLGQPLTAQCDGARPAQTKAGVKKRKAGVVKPSPA